MMPHAIEVVDDQPEARVDVSRLVRSIEQVLDRHDHSFPVSVLLTDDASIRDLNRRFLGHDWPTDVITFPREASDAQAVEEAVEEGAGAEGGGAGGGDVVVSVETARRESSERGIDLENEVILYAVHGVLHLIGFDDRDDESARRMHRETGEALRALGIDTSRLGSEFAPGAP